MGLQQEKPSATLHRNVAHGLGPTVNRFGVHSPPGGFSTVAGFFRVRPRAGGNLETQSQDRRHRTVGISDLSSPRIAPVKAIT